MSIISDNKIGDIVIWNGPNGIIPLIIIKTKNVNRYNDVRFQILNERSFPINLQLEKPPIITYDNESR